MSQAEVKRVRETSWEAIGIIQMMALAKMVAVGLKK